VSSSAIPPDSSELPEAARGQLLSAAGVLTTLGRVFAEAGHDLALVGGPVRDSLLGRLSSAASADLDFTTDAHPDLVLELLQPVAETTWDVGIRFGTVGAMVGGREVEITTYRAESYDPESRKPDVAFGTRLDEDLMRRDFTINAMAIRLPSLELVDLFGGRADLDAGMIRTPGTPQDSFSDDPLRMMRAARFSAQLGFEVAPEVVAAMTEQAERLSIVSPERIREELMKIVMSPAPRRGLTLLVDTGLSEYVLPELPMLRLEPDEHHHHKDVYEHTLTVLEQAMVLEDAHEPASGPDPVLRLAALLHDIGKPRTRRFEDDGRVSFHHHEVVGARMTRKRMQALRFSNEMTEEVATLVALHLRFHGYGTGEWTDSAVRRYVRDAGPLLTRLHKLTRADSTTRNRKRALALQRSYDSLERRIAELAEQEELAAMRPDLDGREIMRILDIPPGREVGEAYQFLLDLRLDRGPMDPALAEEALRAWWSARSD
jgi:poly(A) polymerase